MYAYFGWFLVGRLIRDESHDGEDWRVRGHGR